LVATLFILLFLAAVIAATAIVAAAARSPSAAAAEEKDYNDNDPEATVISTSKHFLLSLSPHTIIFLPLCAVSGLPLGNPRQDVNSFALRPIICLPALLGY